MKPPSAFRRHLASLESLEEPSVGSLLVLLARRLKEAIALEPTEMAVFHLRIAGSSNRGSRRNFIPKDR